MNPSTAAPDAASHGHAVSFLAMGLGLFVLAWILLTLVFKGVAP
jgi:hypothetical protein